MLIHYIFFIVASFAALSVASSCWVVGEVIAQMIFDYNLTPLFGYGLVSVLLITNLLFLYMAQRKIHIIVRELIIKIITTSPRHVLLGLGLLWLVVKLKRSFKERN